MSILTRSFSSRSLTKLDGTINEYLGSKEFEDDMRQQAGYGRWKGLKVGGGERSFVLVPENSYNKLTGLFRADYDKGLVPSKGYMHLKWVMVFLVSHVPKSSAGSVTLSLKDPGWSLTDPLPDTSFEMALSSLPRVCLLTTDYDLPLSKKPIKLGDRGEMRRMFLLSAKVTGLVGAGDALSLFPIWDCDFRSSCNNYEVVPCTSVPITRCVRSDVLSCVAELNRYVKGTLLSLPRSSVSGARFAAPELINQNESESDSSTAVVPESAGVCSAPPQGLAQSPALFNGVEDVSKEAIPKIP
nr:movement protein [Grapevine line pattern virus]